MTEDTISNTFDPTRLPAPPSLIMEEQEKMVLCEGATTDTDDKTPVFDSNDEERPTASLKATEKLIFPTLSLAVEVPKHRGKQKQQKNTNSWSQPAGECFKVRGKHYLRDWKKYKSEETIFKARGVDLLLSDEFGPKEIGRHAGILNGKLRDIPTFLLNFRFSWGVLVLYFEIPSQYLPILRSKYATNASSNSTAINTSKLSPHDKAIHDFLMGNDEVKNSKLKLIPKVVEGNILCRKLIGKPVIIGKKLPIQYIYVPQEKVEIVDDNKATTTKVLADFLEADLDIGSSSKNAKRIIDVCRKYMKTLTVDIGFVVEGSCKEQLPERLLASARIHHVDPAQCPKL